MSNLVVRNNSDKLLRELENKKTEILESIGLQAEANAKVNINRAGRIDTSRLINSISHTVVGNTVFIGSNIPYAVWHEVGSGIYADDGNGRKSPWAYQDSKGQWHNTKGLKPIHFLKNAIADHISDYEQIAVNILKG